jgi:hypothetical protein
LGSCSLMYRQPVISEPKSRPDWGKKVCLIHLKAADYSTIRRRLRLRDRRPLPDDASSLCDLDVLFALREGPDDSEQGFRGGDQ